MIKATVESEADQPASEGRALVIRDPLALAMLGAWLNCPVDKLPAEMRAHTCEQTMTAWKRVGEAAVAFLSESQSAEIARLTEMEPCVACHGEDQGPGVLCLFCVNSGETRVMSRPWLENLDASFRSQGDRVATLTARCEALELVVSEKLEERAQYFERTTGHFDREDAARSYRATAKEIFKALSTLTEEARDA